MSEIDNKVTEPVEPGEELTERQQAEIAGGLNPQPLPPGRAFSHF